MGIIEKRAIQRAFRFAERKVCKRFQKAAPELPKEILAFALRYKGF